MEKNNIVLTTAPFIDGYRIVKQCGVVYGETVFKHGVLSSLKAGILNTIDSFKFWSREVAGSMDLIEKARAYAYDKMIEEAKRRGANAIISIDSDNTFGENLMYLQLYGTAVVIVPEAEFDPASIEFQPQPERLSFSERLNEALSEEGQTEGRYNAGSKDFLDNLDSMENMAEIWDGWQLFELKDYYGAVDKYINTYMEQEKKYGTLSNLPEIKATIRELLHK